MKLLLRRLGAVLLWIVVALLLVPVVVPPFLDRIYYRGPVSDHFDGEHFFNPDGEPAGWNGGGFPIGRMLRFGLGIGRAPWPERVAVRQTKPVARLPVPADYPRAWLEDMSPDPSSDAYRLVPMRVTWIGHATVLIQTAGLNILTDPVWSERTGPFELGPRRVRAPGVRFEDLPKIDLVVVSHNHYDHLDLPTLRRLWQRDHPAIFTSRGNDTILKDAGIDSVAFDWGGGMLLRPGYRVTIVPVHHWGSRWFKDRDRALWSGFRLDVPGGGIFFAGDTGMGDGRWIDEQETGWPLRLAILPIGAYRPAELMARNHIGPVEAVDVFERLHAANALAVHWGTFQLADEGVNEAPALLAATLRKRGIPADRFRAPEPGVAWDVPPLAPR